MSSPNVSFDTIPSTTRKPGQYIEYNTRMAVQGLPANLQKDLIIGQKLTAPSAWAGSHAYSLGDKVMPTVSNGHYYICTTAGTSGAEPTWATAHGSTVADGATLVWTEYASADASASALTVYGINSDTDAKTYFGEGSQVHLMAKAALKANLYLNLSAIGIADSGSNFASGTFTIAGTAGGSGFIRAWIGDVPVEITFAATDAAATIAARLMTAINATNDLPVIASISGAVVACTARNSGVVDNQVKLATEYTAGKNVTNTAVTMSGGTTDADVQTALDKVIGERYNVINPSYNDATSLGKIKTHLATVSSAIEKHPGVCVFGHVNTIATAQTLADALNDGRSTFGNLKGSKTPAFIMGAIYAAVYCSVEDPAQPLNDLVLTGVIPPDVADRTTRSEQETLLLNGVTPLEVRPGNVVVIARAISTYQSDVSFLDVTTIRTLDYVRDALCDRIAQRFARSKLSEKTPPRVRSELYGVLKQLELLEIIERVDANKDGLIVERDTVDANRLNAKIPCDVVNGLHIFAGQIDLIL